RTRRSKGDLAPAGRLHQYGAQAKAMVVRRGQCLVDKHHGTHGYLNVWRDELWRCGDEGTAFSDVGGQRPASLSFEQLSTFLTCRCNQCLLIGQVVEQDERMILQIFADRQINDGRDIERSKRVGTTDPGKHENMWRAVSAGRENDLPFGSQCQLLAVVTSKNAARASAVEFDPLYQRVG